MRSTLPGCGLIVTALVFGSGPVQSRAAEPRIAAALQPFVDRGVLAGAVTLVSSPDKNLSVDTVGYTDVAAKIPMRQDAVFWIASMSKPMTAAGLMILVDEGKVKLDDPVEKYLPEFRGQWLAAERDKDRTLLRHPKRPPTVRDVLRHTSGMPFKSSLEVPTLDLLPLRVAVRSYAMTPLEYEPGDRYQYSNAGINTAGRIMEVVSGMAYEEFMRVRLFDPLGMPDTTFRPDAKQAARVAKSYKPDAKKTGLTEIKVDQLHYPLDDKAREPFPAGGLFSTAADVGAFCRMVLNGGTAGGRRYLSEAAVREMTSTQTGALINGGRGEGGYGLGWSTTRKAKDDRVIPGPCGHGGAYATNMWIDPDRKLITVYLVQHAGFPAGVDGGKIRRAFEDAAVEVFGKK